MVANEMMKPETLRGAALPARSARTPLAGIFQRFGKSLPNVERVAGTLKVLNVSPSTIDGILFNGRETIRVRFESNTRGPLAALRDYAEALPGDLSNTALSNAMLSTKVSGRPWVEEDGSIVLLIRSFMIIAPNNANDNFEAANPAADPVASLT